VAALVSHAPAMADFMQDKNFISGEYRAVTSAWR
jgi:hypothetical protein